MADSMEEHPLCLSIKDNLDYSKQKYHDSYFQVDYTVIKM